MPQTTGDKAGIPLSIAPELKATVPGAAVGWITATANVTKHDKALWQEIEAAAGRFRGMTPQSACQIPPIKALRDAYRALGNDCTRYRGSNEALVRRIIHGKELYPVNTVVDINTLISLETLYSAGTFDLDRIRPPVTFRTGRPAESYLGIGKGEIHLAGLPVFADQLGPFGSTTSDSQRTMVRRKTTRIMMVVISFLGSEGMTAALARAARLLARHASASSIETGVVE